MNDFKNNNKEQIDLNIGDFVIVEKEAKIVHTLLGSCISIIFYVPNVIAMVSHAQMPSPSKKEVICNGLCCKSLCSKKLDNKTIFRYVSCTLDYMINYVKLRGIQEKDIQVTLLGGATLLDKNNNNDSIGTRNIKTALKIIKKNNIPIYRRIIGGNIGISLWYHTKNNKLVIMKHNDRIKIIL